MLRFNKFSKRAQQMAALGLDEPDGLYGFCKQCECNVYCVQVDCGMGDVEYWGAHSTHTDWRDACPECGSEDIGPPRLDDEGDE